VDSKKSSMVEDFQEYFDLELANTPEKLESVYRVRYRVYCEEFGYEPADAFPNQLETDEFDENASHCLVTHKLTGMPAGCARLTSSGTNRPCQNRRPGWCGSRPCGRHPALSRTDPRRDAARRCCLLSRQPVAPQ
jgi:hypothetical protein